MAFLSNMNRIIEASTCSNLYGFNEYLSKYKASTISSDSSYYNDDTITTQILSNIFISRVTSDVEDPAITSYSLYDVLSTGNITGNELFSDLIDTFVNVATTKEEKCNRFFSTIYELYLNPFIEKEMPLCTSSLSLAYMNEYYGNFFSSSNIKAYGLVLYGTASDVSSFEENPNKQHWFRYGEKNILASSLSNTTLGLQNYVTVTRTDDFPNENNTKMMAPSYLLQITNTTSTSYTVGGIGIVGSIILKPEMYKDTDTNNKYYITIPFLLSKTESSKGLFQIPSNMTSTMEIEYIPSFEIYN